MSDCGVDVAGAKDARGLGDRVSPEGGGDSAARRVSVTPAPVPTLTTPRAGHRAEQCAEAGLSDIGYVGEVANGRLLLLRRQRLACEQTQRESDAQLRRRAARAHA